MKSDLLNHKPWNQQQSIKFMRDSKEKPQCIIYIMRLASQSSFMGVQFVCKLLISTCCHSSVTASSSGHLNWILKVEGFKAGVTLTALTPREMLISEYTVFMGKAPERKSNGKNPLSRSSLLLNISQITPVTHSLIIP